MTVSHEDPQNGPEIPSQLRDWYVNTIWGKKADNDDALFEVMSLQVFQAGLAWNMILNKRDAFREAFGFWNIKFVSCFGSTEIDLLLNNPKIIRNRLKIQAAIFNASVVSELQQQHKSFCNWFYTVLPGNDYPTIQAILSKTFKFMGPEISRMWLMASGRITEDEGNKYRP
ncbi:DNA-3-methyladenine glycosylase I [SAR202 cluster bacterium AD-804-J14_MRT_500m]|nr:DNA-3-methyladenine glycosylase I [SAR202 cluster bacterium AD-804-J14_MRT_500m]